MERNIGAIIVLLTLSTILALAGGCGNSGTVPVPQPPQNTVTASPPPSLASPSTTTSVQLIAAEDAFNLIQQNQGNAAFVILDVRTPGEFKGGHIPGAVNIDVGSPEFKSNIEKLDRNTQYLVYCRTGVRSAQATQTMSALGFGQIYDLSGGINRWMQDGYPTET